MGDKKKKETNAADVNARRPGSIARVFMVDVSWSAVKGGIVREVCQGIKEAIYGKSKDEALGRLNGEEEVEGEEEWKIPEGRIGIVTFDRAVHYYNLSVSQDVESGICLGCVVAEHESHHRPDSPNWRLQN